MIKKQKRNLILLYLTPTFLLYLVFLIYPFLKTFYLSLTSWNGFSKVKSFIGLDNFKAILYDTKIHNALWHNLYLFIIGTFFTFIISMLFAVALTKSNFKEKNIYRVVFFFPNVLSVVIVSMIWMFIYNPTFGILNEFLRLIGLDSLTKAWLGELGTVLPALAVPWIWMSIGFYMIMFIAGIQNIPTSYYEAATIDGANQFQQFFKITFPLLWEIIRITLVFFLLNAFSGTFTIVNITTKGGPARASDLLTTYMYENAFISSKFGYATAIGVSIFILMLLLSAIMLKFTERETIEY